MEQEKAQKEKDNVYLDTEIEKLNDAYGKLSKERKTLEEKLQVWFITLPFKLACVIFTKGNKQFPPSTRRQGQSS